MFGELLEPKIRMLDFAIFSTFASFANHSHAPWIPHFKDEWAGPSNFILPFDHPRCGWDLEERVSWGHQYSAGTSFSAPRSITEKPMEVYYLDEWIIITLHVAGFLYIQHYFNTSITVLTNQVWKLLIALFKVPNTCAFTVQLFSPSQFIESRGA